MKKIMVFVTTLTVLFLGVWFTSEETFASKGADNNSEVNELLKRVPHKIYEEYDDATGNIKTTLEYKDIKKILENEGILTLVPETTYSGDPKIRPNTQIYFYATWKESKKDFNFKYAIFDANSKEILVSGSSFHFKKGRE